MSKPQHIAIVGGGWAGLAAAASLCQHNVQVSIFESSPQLGGRARSIEWNGMRLDNGQHLMIGAYQQMLDLLSIMQADSTQLFTQIPQRMLMLDSQTGHTAFDLNLPSFPAPLHLLFGVLKTPSLKFVDKIRLLLRFNALMNTPINHDMSVSDWLDRAGLPAAYTENLLKPVCLAALTTHPHQASAKAFQSVLQQTFNAAANFTDLLIPNTDLSRIFPELAAEFIKHHGGEIHLRSKVQTIHIENNRVSGLTINNTSMIFDQVILATPPAATTKLLAPLPTCQNIVEQIRCLKYEPVSTLYLKFDSPVSLPYPMLGMLNGYAQWVFERKQTGQACVLAVVMSAQGEYLNLAKDELLKAILKELSQCINNLPPLLDSKLIIEKRATIQCHPNVDINRPSMVTNLSNLNLCGDYVYIEENNAPGLPSTLEGSVRSGVKCAQILISTQN